MSTKDESISLEIFGSEDGTVCLTMRSESRGCYLLSAADVPIGQAPRVVAEALEAHLNRPVKEVPEIKDQEWLVLLQLNGNGFTYYETMRVMAADHAAAIDETLAKYPEVKREITVTGAYAGPNRGMQYHPVGRIRLQQFERQPRPEPPITTSRIHL